MGPILTRNPIPRPIKARDRDNFGDRGQGNILDEMLNRPDNDQSEQLIAFPITNNLKFFIKSSS